MENTAVMEKDHILVCVSSAPSNARIIHTGADLAKAFGASFTALYVKTPHSPYMEPGDKNRLQEHIALAQSLGAQIATVEGEDISFQIAEFARLSRITKVVIGRSNGGIRTIFGKKTLTERLIEQAPSLDFYIIPDVSGENKGCKTEKRHNSAVPSFTQIAISLGILAASTGIGQLFHNLNFTEANIITVYILGALLSALFTRSNVCSMLNSFASVLLFNFFFTEPKLSLYAYETGYPVTFAIMLAASLITGTLANRLADHAKQTAQAAYRTKILFETNQLLQRSEEEDLLSTTASQLHKLLSREVIVHTQAQPVGSGWKQCAVESSDVIYGVLAVSLQEGPLEPFESSVLASVLGECALAMESRRNAREKEAAAVLAKNEQLRANLLRTISHDLRTPLTSISGNTENLLQNHSILDEEARMEILRDINADTIWLIQLVENLLAITRIGEGRTRLNITTQLVDEVVTEALSHIRRKAHTHIIRNEITDELLLAKMDARLISQVIINLVDNALKYTPAGSVIEISAQKEGEVVAIRVSDNGPGIPDSQKQHVFEMFYTGSNNVADCRRSLGLGLALCRSIVEAHDGEITLTDHVPSGCIFTFTLPVSEVPYYE